MDDAIHKAADLAFLSGGGEMGALIRSHDWAATPLGPPQRWPHSLKTAVRIMLTSRQPIWIGWSAELIYFYNDPYKAIIGGRHPWALGRPTREVWREIWAEIEPRLAIAMSGDQGTYDEAQLLVMERHGYPEETYYTFSYSPIHDDDGGVGGIICANTDDTTRVVGERQMALLRELASVTTQARTWEQACRKTAGALATNSRDLPFALLYLAAPKSRTATLVASAGIAPEHTAAPGSLPLAGPALWPIGAALEQRALQLVALAPARFGALPVRPWNRAPAEAAVLPIPSSDDQGHRGALIVGLSPVRQLDDGYRGFLELVGHQVAGTIANADAYEEAQRRAEALAALDRAKTAFFANVSHEFRTPLTLMLGPLEELKREFGRSSSPLSVPQYQQVDLVHRNGLRLLKLTNALLDFSRIEAGRQQASYQPTDLAMLTADLASVFRSTIEKADIRLTIDCPPLSEPAYVDRDMWEKIVLNLISNAFKFTFEGEISVTLRLAGRRFVLSVRDTGTGVQEDQLGLIFERFHRVPGATGRSFEGSGIGLALVQELARLHGGLVSVDSVFGRGSTFTVLIPRGHAHLPPAQVQRTTGSPRGVRGAAPFVEEAMRWLPDGTDGTAGADAADDPLADVPLAGDAVAPSGSASERARILVADDNADMRAYVQRLLRGRYDVELVADGQAALEAARARPPDLVLSDIMMPQRDGISLLKALRAGEATRTVPVILLSARAGEEASAEGLQAGADDYLIKPFSARELLARIGSTLKLALVRRQGEETVASLLEGMSDGFHAIDADWRFTRFNAAARRLFAEQGVDADALLGKRIFDEVLAEARHSDGGRALIDAMKHRRPAAIEGYYAPWRRWYHVRHYPTPGGGVASFFQDVTTRRGAEAQIGRSRDTLASMIENAPFGVCLIDADLRLTHLSAGARDAFEPVHPLNGQNFAEVLRRAWPERIAGAILARLSRTLASGEPYSTIITVADEGGIGARAAYDWHAERMMHPDGRFGVVCYFYEVA